MVHFFIQESFEASSIYDNPSNGHYLALKITTDGGQTFDWILMTFVVIHGTLSGETITRMVARGRLLMA